MQAQKNEHAHCILCIIIAISSSVFCVNKDQDSDRPSCESVLIDSKTKFKLLYSLSLQGLSIVDGWPLALTQTSCTFCSPYLVQIFSFHCCDLCSLRFNNSGFITIFFLWLCPSVLHIYKGLVLELIEYLCLLYLFTFTSVTLPQPNCSIFLSEQQSA